MKQVSLTELEIDFIFEAITSYKFITIERGGDLDEFIGYIIDKLGRERKD